MSQKEKTTEVPLENVIKAFAKNIQVQEFMRAIQDSLMAKTDNSQVSLTIVATKTSYEIKMVEGEETASLFDGVKQEDRPLRKEEGTLKDYLSETITGYINRAYMGLEGDIAKQTGEKVAEKVIRSLVEEIDRGIKLVWHENKPRKTE